MYKISEGFNIFYSKCVACSAYVKVYKDSTKDNEGILTGLKRSIIMDARQTTINTYRYIRSRDRMLVADRDFMLVEGGNSLKTNIQSLEDVSSTSFMQDNNLIYAFIKMTKYSLKVSENAKISVEECPVCGFYPLMESASGATVLMSYYSLIYNTTEAKYIESEYNYVRSLIAGTDKYFK